MIIAQKNHIATILFLGFFHNFYCQSFPYVQIGDQEWSQKNAEIVEFRNGEKILEIKTKEDWINVGNRKEPAWCYYQFDENNAFLGKLYNYFVISDSRNIAPNGWKVPTFFDYYNLIIAIDPLCSKKDFEKNGSLAGGSIKMKELSNNSQFTCQQINSDFNAILAGGYAPSINYPESDWVKVGEKAMFWCLTDWVKILEFFDDINVDEQKNNIRSEKMANKAIVVRLKNYNCFIDADDDPKINGYYLRFIKD